jgi:PncC family amidohydrolase
MDGDPPDLTADLAARCLAMLRARRETLAVAESLTAGMVSATVAAIPGASDVLRGGLVAYASDAKTSVLGVDPAVVERYGVVSGECAAAMAAGARTLFAATWSVSTTGVAGPDEQEGKPVGTVFVGIAGPTKAWSESVQMRGSRQRIREGTVVAALRLLYDAVS